MIKKIAITIILLSLFFAGSMIAQERYTLDIYVTVHAAYRNNDVDIGYMDIDRNKWDIQEYNVGSGVTVIHCQIEVWPDDPCPEWVFAEGWGPYSSHDYDECDSTFSSPMYLELWLGIAEPPNQGD